MSYENHKSEMIYCNALELMAFQSESEINSLYGIIKRFTFTMKTQVCKTYLIVYRF